MAKPSVFLQLESFDPYGCSYGECYLFVVTNIFSELCTQLFNAEFQLCALQKPFSSIQSNCSHKFCYVFDTEVVNILRAPS